MGATSPSGSVEHGLARRAVAFAPASATDGPRVCVVAEIGVNHDGRLDYALDLVDAAAVAGADAVKLQLFDPRFLLSRQAELADYQRRQHETSVFDMLARLMLQPDDMAAVRERAREAGLGFIVTPFSLENVPTLEQLDVDAVKIASPDVVNLPLLERVSALGRTMIVSTGTSELEELAPAVRIIGDLPCCLLHCVSSYPTPQDAASLNAMVAMAQQFGLPVGYSDHTDQLMTGALAVAAGACVIEKHLTYDTRAAGPDHAASFDPEQFRQYVKAIHQAARMLGPIAKAVQPAEREVRRICRQSLCIRRDLPAGHRLSEDDLTVRRPGTGIPASQWKLAVGQVLARPVHAQQLLMPDDLCTPPLPRSMDGAA